VIEKNLNEHLRAHYAAQSLPVDALARLIAATNEPRTVPLLAVVHRRFAYAMAACLAIAVLGNAYFAWSARSAWREVTSLREAAFRGAFPAPKRAPQWVALRTVMDGCPKAKMVAPMFDELEQEHGDDPRVLFFTYNITDARSRRECQKVAEVMGFDWMMPTCCQSGTINLGNCRERAIVSQLDRPEQLPEMEAALTLALKEDKPRP